jgi:Concanavalin A-like lectin/glucanases superfamily
MGSENNYGAWETNGGSVSLPLEVLVPLLLLGLACLFPFLGCTGEDPTAAYERGKADEKKQQDDEDTAKKAQDQQQAEQEKYENKVGLTPDIVSYWRLSEGESGDMTAYDKAPDMPQNGEYKNVAGGGVVRSVQGVLSLANEPGDKSAQFDGTRGYVEVPHDVLLNPPQDFSIEVWIRPEVPLPPQPQVVFGSYEVDASGSVSRGFVLDVIIDPANGPRVRARVGYGAGFTSLDASLESGAEHDGWRHVVVTYSAEMGELILYVNSDNGVPDAQAPGGPPPAPQTPILYLKNETSPLRIGAGQTEAPAPAPTPAQFFKGRIDEVALYRVPLSGNEVKDHFRRVTAVA